MNNLISGAAAIDVVRKCPIKEVTPAYMLINKAEVMTELMMLPSVEPETCAYWDRESNFCALHRPSAQPETAQWVKMLINPNLYKCSNCQVAWNKRLVFDNEGYSENIFMKYCPCCGRKMKAKIDYE